MPSVAHRRTLPATVPKTIRRTRLPFSKRPIARRHPRTPEEAMAAAYELGFYRGQHDQHYEPRNMTTGAEWLRWLEGWRAGQVQLLTQRKAEATEREARERSMTEQLGRLS